MNKIPDNQEWWIFIMQNMPFSLEDNIIYIPKNLLLNIITKYNDRKILTLWEKYDRLWRNTNRKCIWYGIAKLRDKF